MKFGLWILVGFGKFCENIVNGCDVSFFVNKLFCGEFL